MSKANEILLEVKRRLGDTTTPYPDETDSLAYLNKAVHGIYNFGVYLKSPRIKKIKTITAINGTAEIEDGISFLESLVSIDSNRALKPLTDPVQLMRLNHVNSGPLYYSIDGDVITLYPQPSEPEVENNLAIAYFPRLKDITSREDEVPFTPELNGVIEAWVIGLIAKQGAGFSDIEFATQMNLGHTISRYFRGQYPNFLTGRGPW